MLLLPVAKPDRVASRCVRFRADEDVVDAVQALPVIELRLRHRHFLYLGPAVGYFRDDRAEVAELKRQQQAVPPSAASPGSRRYSGPVRVVRTSGSVVIQNVDVSAVGVDPVAFLARQLMHHAQILLHRVQRLADGRCSQAGSAGQCGDIRYRVGK
jgi:hypothetical protein